MQMKFAMPLTPRERQSKQAVGSSDYGCFASLSAEFKFLSKASQFHGALDDRREFNLSFAVLGGAL